MISVRSRNGGELGLEMGETELEEGEALSYNEDGGGDSTVDPDVALSYIEEKLHSVLGHFQKDFEGIVSAENLGAKYGHYGSFLPTYQRSPSSAHNKTTPDARNSDLLSSPRKLSEVQKPKVSSTSSPSWRSREALGKAISLENSLRGNGHQLPRKHAEQSSPSGVVKKPANPCDQKGLKVRIKVGSENLVQKNAEIYSGLGLEVSPSSSLDDSPTFGAAMHLHGIEESPISILRIMTSFPGDKLLLSPLPGSLINLTEVLSDGSLSSKKSQRFLDRMIPSPNERNEMISPELANRMDRDANTSFLKNETEVDVDVSDCDELVSKALKLPLLVDSHHSDVDPSKGTVDVKVEENASFKEHLTSEPIRETYMPGKKQSRKTGSRSKVPELKMGNAVNKVAARRQDVVLKGENSPAFERSEPDTFTQKKGLDDKSSDDPYGSSVAKAGISVSEVGSKKSKDKQTEKRKEKKVMRSIESQKSDAPKDQSAAVVPSSTPKSGMKSGANLLASQNDLSYRQNGLEKPVHLYKDFFGDLEFEEDDNESISGDITSGGKLGDPQHVSKRSCSESHSTSKENVDAKKSGKPRFSEKHHNTASHVPPTSDHGPSVEAPGPVKHLVNEDWVSCDKCGKWRLLPLGTNPNSLPNKWVCRMLTWLRPGLNRCNVPEDVTTNTLRASYTVGSAVGPTSDNQQLQLNTSGQDLQNAAALSALSSGKKKHGPSNSIGLDGASGYQHMQESGSQVNKFAGKEKASLIKHSDKGTNVKVKSKRESELEDSRASKRVRSSDQANNKDLKETKDAIPRKDEKMRGPHAEDKSALKKRKSKLLNGPEGFSDSAEHKQKSDYFVEQTSENEHLKEKKARVSKSGLKDTTRESKISSDTDRKGRSSTTKHPFVSSHSSSSKVSGSDKNQTGHKEQVKGSPVESVSSSPLRFASSEKVTSAGKNLVVKDEDNIKATESARGGFEHLQENEEKPSNRKNKPGEHSVSPYKGEKLSSSKVLSGGIGDSREQSQSRSRQDGRDDIIKVQDKNHALSLEPTNEKLPEKKDLAEASGTVKGKALPPLARVQNENVLNGNSSENGDGQKAQIPRKKSENQSVLQPTSTKNPTLEAPSPLRRDSSSHDVNKALKDAKDLKHLADRLKGSGSADSNGIYLQAALKFLHGASLLESGCSEATKHNDMMKSMQIYSSTAKLFEFCALNYEKSNDMSAAALAYKCVEVSYMRVLYFSNANASRDRNELQRALQIVPTGESPSSSASDIDNNLNNQAPTDKAASAMVAGSPQVSGSHVITSRNRAGLLRILNFAQDVSSAMEASRKSRSAFSAAASKLAETSNGEGISSLKRALDFNFQDIEALLRLVRVAMEAISR